MATARLFKKQVNEISTKWLSSAHLVLPKDGIDICSVLLKKYSAKNLELEDLLNSIEEICLSHPHLISGFLHLFYDRPLSDDSSFNEDSVLGNDSLSMNSRANSPLTDNSSTDLRKESISQIEIARKNSDSIVSYKEEVTEAENLPPNAQLEQAPQRFYRPQPPTIRQVNLDAGKKPEQYSSKSSIQLKSLLSEDVENEKNGNQTKTNLPPISQTVKTTRPTHTDLPPSARGATVTTLSASIPQEPKRKSSSEHNASQKTKYSAKNDKKRTAEEQEEINRRLQLASQLIANVLSERISPNGSKKKKTRKNAALSNF